MDAWTRRAEDLIARMQQPDPLAGLNAMVSRVLTGEVQALADAIRHLEAQPKSESRLAWEAVHPSWGTVVADGIDRMSRIFYGEIEVPQEVREAGCRR